MTSWCWSCAKTRRATRGQDLRAFLQALTSGQRAVRANPRAAAELIVKANPSRKAKLQLTRSASDASGDSSERRSKPYGWQDPNAWASFGALDARS